MRQRVAAAALAIAAFFVVDATGSAQAQFFPWGGWDNSPPWQQRRAQQRRAIPRNVPEDESEKVVSNLPKPTGPLTIVVSIGKQTVSIYDNNQKIASSPISTGMAGHETPTGIFSILEKNRYHYSNLYGGAPMPFMNRITNSGVAMHEGVVPGYPASHGCIRLPAAFARNLFGITEIGARVIVTQEDPTPSEFESSHIIEPLPPANADAAKAGFSPVTPASAEGVSHVRTREQAAAERAGEREPLAAAVIAAEATKTAAIDKTKAAAETARIAKDDLRKARNEKERLADEARKAARDADSALDSFADHMRDKVKKIDVSKLDADALKKEQDDEVAEENKVLDLAKAVAPAKALIEKQADVVKAAAANADTTEKARRDAATAIKGTEQAITDAKAAVVSANAIEAKKDNPVSIFVSRKTGRLVAKLGMGDPVIDVPVKITDPNTPIGTHVFTANGYTPGEKALKWGVVTFNAAASTAPRKVWRKRRHEDQDYVAAAKDDADPAHALERIEIPKETADRLAELAKPGSSFIISDYGLSRETSKRTDFIIEPWRSSGEAPTEYEGGRVE